MAKYKIPSQAASGSDTFSDNLVGNQITNGTSQLTNNNFALERITPERNQFDFKTTHFSDFITLDDIGNNKKDTNIEFKNVNNNANVSLFGSLKLRLKNSITNIINNFPAGILIDNTRPLTTSNFTAKNISYDSITNLTNFEVEQSMLFNPFNVLFNDTVNTIENKLRDFNVSFKEYVINVNNIDYQILDYTPPTSLKILKFTVSGNPFNNLTNYSVNYLIKPNNQNVELFFDKLDDLSKILLNRESIPLYTSTFIVKKDDESGETEEKITWPLTKDNWNIVINGIEFENYIKTLYDVSDEIDTYKSNLIIRFLTSPQLFELILKIKKLMQYFNYMVKILII